MKRKPKTQLEDFPAEALAAFIRERWPFWQVTEAEVIKHLREIEAKRQMGTIRDEVDRLAEKLPSMIKDTPRKDFLAIHERIRRLWRRYDALRPVAFPTVYNEDGSLKHETMEKAL